MIDQTNRREGGDVLGYVPPTAIILAVCFLTGAFFLACCWVAGGR
jgi:hypothetical protein